MPGTARGSNLDERLATCVQQGLLTEEDVRRLTGKAVLKPPEVAEFLQIGINKTRAMMKAGIIPSVQLGNERRTPMRALLDWLDRKAQDEAS